MTANAARTLTRRASAVLPETQQVNFLFDASLLLGHVNPQVAAVLGRKALQARLQHSSWLAVQVINVCSQCSSN